MPCTTFTDRGRSKERGRETERGRLPWSRGRGRLPWSHKGGVAMEVQEAAVEPEELTQRCRVSAVGLIPQTTGQSLAECKSTPQGCRIYGHQCDRPPFMDIPLGTGCAFPKSQTFFNMPCNTFTASGRSKERGRETERGRLPWSKGRWRLPWCHTGGVAMKVQEAAVEPDELSQRCRVSAANLIPQTTGQSLAECELAQQGCRTY